MAAAALLMAACSNSDDFDVQKPAEKAGVYHFEATIAAPDADASMRTVYTDEGTTINVKWEVGDKIALVYNGVVDVAEVKTVDDVTGKATIEATITGTPADNDDVTLAYPADAVSSATPSALFPSFPFTPKLATIAKLAGQDGTLEFIQNNLDLRMGPGKLAVSGDKATLKESVAIPSIICIWKLTLQDESSNALSATKLTVKYGTSTQARATSTGKSAYYLAIVPSMLPSGDLTIEATVGSDTYTYTKTGTVSLTAGKYYQSTVKMASSFTEVTTFSELQTALSAGKNVKLMNDIVCTAEIEITSGALTIDGNGKKLSTTSAIRAFKVESSATVAFKDLTLTGFVSGGGPAINNLGTTVLDGCTISNCHVNNTDGGGAIENQGKLYAINTTFSGNYSGEIGGAINNYGGSLYMSDCTFNNNYTTKSDAYWGGAIGINGGSEVRLINCSFSGNKYGTNTGTNDIGVYWNPTSYTIAGCTGATIASDDGVITPNTTGTATLNYSDLSNILFTYTAE